MIQKENGEHVAYCNDCGDAQYAGTLGSKEFVRSLRKNGWLVRKSDDETEWEHFCRDCAEAMT